MANMRYASKLAQLIKFTQLFHKLQNVKRVMFASCGERYENDVEHSYQIALTAWYIINSQKLELDSDLVVKYALIHDLVEAYSGDMYFSRDPVAENKKKNVEQHAVLQLRKDFPEFTDYFDLIERYEARLDEESKFVYAIDKVIPMVNELLNDGKSIKENKLELVELRRAKEHKVSVSSSAKDYYDLIIAIFLEEEHKYFYTPGSV